MMVSARHLFISMLLGAALSAASPALAGREATPSQLDHRVRTIMYQPDEVFKFYGHYGFQSTIEFAVDESIQSISMGDSTAWVMQPSGNRIFLKPVEQSATTNMTVLTDKRTYLFELHAREAQDINDKEMTFILRFLYPSAGSGTGGDNFTSMDSGSLVKKYSDSVPLPDILNEAYKYNFKYSISGPEVIAPIRIFDDGQFTFFQFRNRNADVPAFFTVDSKNNESIINYRTRGDFIVVERVAERFTLRYGNDVICVFNEAFPASLRARPISAPGESPAAPPAQTPPSPQFRTQ